MILNRVGKILLPLPDDNDTRPTKIIIAEDCFKLLNNGDQVKEVLIHTVEKLYGSMLLITL